MRTSNTFPWLAIAALLAASLACMIDLGGPATPEATIPVSTDAVDSLEEIWEGSLEAATETGQISLVINETQLTSLVAMRLQQQEDPLLQNPQIYLRDNRIRVYGTVVRGNLSANVSFALAVEVDADGKPAFDLESADFGPFPVPDGLLTGISAMVEEAFTGAVGPAATGLRIETLTIQDGLMAITGQVR